MSRAATCPATTVQILGAPRHARLVERGVLTCRECDRKYRQRDGTASAAWRAGQLPGRRRGRAILVSATVAERLFGFAL